MLLPGEVWVQVYLLALLSALATPGNTVVVSGVGAVGLCAVLAAARLGASRVVAMSRHAARQALADRIHGPVPAFGPPRRPPRICRCPAGGPEFQGR
ncbi:threonine dehydrogenase-like Zn-dependent dehydrogenase [Actinokineospora baliensis]|nr:threonine dehydrogenase-like Zn-dependent dehydrogenase [Actinokineospora baliensis]